ncbi:IS66 family insertion sequence element accessory protein TnpA [Thermicanus aegyptius]
MTKLALRKEWIAAVNFKASGKTAKAWCDEHQLKTHWLWYWVRK